MATEKAPGTFEDHYKKARAQILESRIIRPGFISPTTLMVKLP